MIIDAKKKFTIIVNKSHVDRACASEGQCDPNYCVVAEATKDAFKALGRKVLAVQIGPQRTVIVLPGKEIRYKTPEVLKSAINHFDHTSTWSLPEGKYVLEPLPKSLTKKYALARYHQRRKEKDPNVMGSHGDNISRFRKAPAFSIRAVSFGKDKKDNSAKGIAY